MSRVSTQVHQALQRTPQAFEFPDQQNVARTQVLEELHQHRTITARAARHLGMDLGAAGLLQGFDLHGDYLIFGADPHVTDFHRRGLWPSDKFTLLIVTE